MPRGPTLAQRAVAMTLLCATNFSPEAIAANTFAAELSRKRGEPLWLVFVVPAHAAKVYGEDALSSADERLRAEAERLRALGATVTPAVLIGDVAREVPRFAQENAVSLVIAGDASTPSGSSGSGTLGRLGRGLQMPLLAVRHPQPLIAWAKGERPLKVMVGVDETRSTRVAAAFVEGLARLGPIELVGGHVYFPAAECHRFGLPLPAHWDEVSPELSAALHREVGAQLPASLPHRIRLAPAIGRVSDHLCALAEAEKADLLVLGTHHRRALGRLWSVSEQCLPQAAMSVVCVPSTGARSEGDQPVAAIDRVLIATDLSPGGDRAIAWGLGALARGGSADLIHVVTAKPTEAAEARILEQLTDRIPAEAAARGLTVEVHVIQATTPAVGIAAAADRFSSSAIAVAARSSRLAKALFGSTTLGVLETTRRPVLIVPPGEG